MQLFIDFFPLLLFFAAYLWQGIFFATGVAIVASIVQIAWIHWKHGRAGVTHWLSLVIIVVFGGATLLLQDKTFIMWKPTVLYGLFGVILAVGKLGFGRDLIAYLMKGVSLPAAIWTRLTWAWVAFFAFMGVGQLVRRLPLLRADLGPLQGLGRHRTLSRVRRCCKGSGSRVTPPRRPRERCGERPAGRRGRLRGRVPPAGTSTRARRSRAAAREARAARAGGARNPR